MYLLIIVKKIDKKIIVFKSKYFLLINNIYLWILVYLKFISKLYYF